jgi:hypothetical protein
MLSRIFVALLAMSSVLLGASAQDPQTYCSPVTIDAFSVVASATTDAEGSMLGGATGTYNAFSYYIPLSTNYPGPSVFFNVILHPNVTTATENGLQAYGFTLELNGVFHNNTNGNSTFYDVDGSGEVSGIEFTNWGSNVRAAINNTVFLNVTEYIQVGQGTLSHITQCDYTYEFIFNNPLGGASSGANVVGDPQFKGLRGQSFQVHGVDGAVYNLISDANMQLNSRFTFLEGPRPCPVMPSTGKVSVACWSHPGSYLSELALKTSGSSQLSIVSGEASQGFSSVQLDGKSITVGSTVELSFTDSAMTGSLTVDSTHELTIRSGLFEVVVENNDGFVNLRSVYVSAANWPKLAAHGLLGQTWQNKRYGGQVKEIEGEVDDYLVEDDDMFGDSFLFNKF